MITNQYGFTDDSISLINNFVQVLSDLIQVMPVPQVDDAITRLPPSFYLKCFLTPIIQSKFTLNLLPHTYRSRLNAQFDACQLKPWGISVPLDLEHVFVVLEREPEILVVVDHLYLRQGVPANLQFLWTHIELSGRSRGKARR